MIYWELKNPPKMAVVGEAPGEMEARKQIPFVGPEGKYLQRLFQTATFNSKSLNLFNYNITNTVQVQPKGNKYYTLSTDQKESGKVALKDFLLKWKPNVVLALGAEALKVLTNKEGIYKFRGTIVESALIPGLKVFPTIHPGSLIRGEGKYEPILIKDIENARQEAEYPEIVYPKRNVNVLYNITDSIDFLKSVTDSPKFVAPDIETFGGLNSPMSAYGIATSDSDAYVIPKENLKSPSVLKHIGLFANSSTPKIWFNALFDVLHGAYYYRMTYKNNHDAMLAQHAILSNLPKSLAFCASIYTNEVYWKKEGKTIFDDMKKGNRVDWEQFYNYNGYDCCLTYEVYQKQKKLLKDLRTEHPYQLMNSLIEPCLFAMLKGVLIDADKLNEFADINERTIQILEQMKTSTIGDVNVKSSPQLQSLIYDQWKLPVQKEKGKVTTNKRKIEGLERFPTPYKPHLGLIAKLKDHYKRRDFYTLKLDEDGRIRTALKIHGTYTGRFASSSSMTGSGKNLLNIPKRTRMFYVADPGKILCQMDLSQAEARVVAALCKDYGWLKKFNELDLHSEVAAFLFNIPYDKVDKSTHRQVAKRVSHATHYLLGKMLLAELVKCSTKEAQAHKDAYYKLRPKLADWQEEVKRKVRRDKVIDTCYGRKMFFFGPIHDKLFREATAAEPQSTSSDYLNTGLSKMYHDGEPEFEFLLQVYDSIIFQVPNNLEILQRNMLRLRELIQVEIDVKGVPLTIPCDFEIGFNWLDLKSIDPDNPEEVYKKLNEV